jgi:hypothetical protein
MNAPARVAGFVLGLAAVFALALAVGSRVGPLDVGAAEADAGGSEMGHAESAGPAESGGHAEAEPAGAPGEEELPGGLMISSGGYTLSLADTVAQPGKARELAFVVHGPDGPVTSYDVQHEKELHLIVVRRDLTGFQHVHPVLSPDGTWTTDVDLTPGQWRVLADFKPHGADPLTLGADLTVPGRVAAPPETGTTRVAHVDGYTVEVTGDLVGGEHSDVRLTVSRDGRPVTDLQPYLGAFGHLVALRAGDLAYLHVHPEDSTEDGHGEGASAGPAVEFVAEVPSAGSYSLFLDFKHEGVVRTASFRLDASALEETR